MNDRGNIIVAKKVKQNNLEFLISIFSISQLLRFTRYTKRLIVGYDDENLPIYNEEIQRTVENSRIEKIADFLINDPDAIFPTNIVLSIPQAVIEDYNEIDKSNNVEITISKAVFSEIEKKGGHVYLTIIDGQHRIKGIEKAIERLQSEIKTISQVLKNSNNPSLKIKLDYYSKLLERLNNIELIVSFFIDPTLEFQAMIFSTINRTQKSVPQSLVYSLFGLTSSDSPQKTALQTVLSLNSFENSPFFNRVKLYGGTYLRNQSPPLTQATIVKSIIDRISINLRESEKDRFKNRKELLKNISSDLFFRRFYANDKDDVIGDIMFSFFSAVRNTFVDKNGNSYWELNEGSKLNNILQTTVGYLALLEVLGEILRTSGDKAQIDEIEFYENFLKKAKNLNFMDISRYPFTSISKTILYLDMALLIWPPTNQNDPRINRLADVLGRN
ncbi:DGQHR domain-containing protein [Algoriphagus litoralis]|uniref:DGQHR domain-containing protein n=1 Tax=Algoriphagus litoralis TaxID=2202829 RepID=UPI000DB991B3|nr:DGQHR domain-containing protein [Algoriphagus litoralis]